MDRSRIQLFSSSHRSVIFHSTTLFTYSYTAFLMGGHLLMGKEYTESTPHAFHGAVQRRTSSNSASVKGPHLHILRWSFSRTPRRTSLIDSSPLHPSQTSLSLIPLQNSRVSSALGVSSSPPYWAGKVLFLLQKMFSLLSSRCLLLASLILKTSVFLFWETMISKQME